jgi:hypothetical protein
MFSRERSPDELAEKERQRAQKEREKAERQAQREREEFLRTPVGQAHSAYQRGDHVFQYSLDVMNQGAVIVAMVGSSTTKRTSDPSEVLNAVCAQGWELVTGSFVFVHEGEQSRDKFMSSGQNVATKGRIEGFYLFKRCDALAGGGVTPVPARI